jgi:hypothetical protein
LLGAAAPYLILVILILLTRLLAPVQHTLTDVVAHCCSEEGMRIDNEVGLVRFTVVTVFVPIFWPLG